MRDNKTWTNEEDEALRRIASLGGNRHDAAMALDRSEEGVKHRALILGVTLARKDFSSDERYRIITLHLSGMSNKEIHEETGFSSGMISGHLQRWRKSGKPEVRKRPSMKCGNEMKPLGEAILKRSSPRWDKDREAEIRQREGDLKFRKALAIAILNGDNLPSGAPRPLRLVG